MVRVDALTASPGNREGYSQPTFQPSLTSLAWIFLKIGSTAFGGLGATLALLERELVQSRQLLAAEELMTEALTYTKLLPGSTVVHVIAYLGHRLRGTLTVG